MTKIRYPQFITYNFDIAKIKKYENPPTIPFLILCILMAYIPFHAYFTSVFGEYFGYFKDGIIIILAWVCLLYWQGCPAKYARMLKLSFRYLLILYFWAGFITLRSLHLETIDFSSYIFIALRGYLEFPLVGFASFTLINSQKRVSTVFWLVICSATLVSFATLISVFFGIDIFVNYAKGGGTGDVRRIALFGSVQVNTLGVYFSMVATWLYAVILGNRSKYNFNKLIMLHIALISISIGLIFTFSRRAWLGFVFGVIVITLVKRSRNWRNLLTLGVVLFGIYWFFDDFLSARWSLLLGGMRYGGISFRIDESRIIWDLIWSHRSWLAGLGLGAVGPTSIQISHNNLNVHNSYVLALADLGVVGFMIFFGWCSQIINRSIRIVSIRGDEFAQTFGSSACGLLSAALVAGVAGSTMFSLQPATLFWLVAGIVLRFSYEFNSFFIEQRKPF